MFTSTSIRANYSRHVLRSYAHGFTPLSLRAFVARIAAI